MQKEIIILKQVRFRLKVDHQTQEIIQGSHKFLSHTGIDITTKHLFHGPYLLERKYD